MELPEYMVLNFERKRAKMIDKAKGFFFFNLFLDKVHDLGFLFIDF